MSLKNIIDFEVLIDDSFIDFIQDKSVSIIDKKKLLSVINTFEDGDWRYNTFQNFIWDNIAETALSYKDREALINKSYSTLTECAKKLRLTDLSKDQDGQGSELAEIILYGIMKHHYKALPVVPKIFFKQNPQDNAKGADSVHIVVESDDTFSLWFGEAKFYNSIDDDRLYSIIYSVENSLNTKMLEKENSIITSVSDLKEYLKNKQNVYEEIMKLLSSSTSIDNIKSKLQIPILIIHECDITFNTQELTDSYKEQIKNFHKDRAESYFKKQINRMGHSIFKYSEIRFHLILFPVPSKEPIVKRFVENVIHFKNQ